MIRRIPKNFDVSSLPLDTNEIFIRDDLKIQIDGWAKFRHRINIGNNAANLRPVVGSVSSHVQDAYRELAKSHYEVVLSLGSAKLSLIFADRAPQIIIGSKPSLLTFQKSLKDFYFHLGCVLDNLARVIYIINDPQAPIDRDRQNRFTRHRVDWGDIQNRIRSNPSIYRGFTRLVQSKTLDEIVRIRHAFTHGWSPPIDVVGGIPFWPIALRSKREYYWPHDELAKMRAMYRKWVPVMQMTGSDFQFMEQFQNRVFSKLTRGVRKFERTHGLVIL